METPFKIIEKLSFQIRVKSKKLSRLGVNLGLWNVAVTIQLDDRFEISLTIYFRKLSREKFVLPTEKKLERPRSVQQRT